MQTYFTNCQTREDATNLHHVLKALFHPATGTIPNAEKYGDVNREYLQYMGSLYNVPATTPAIPEPAPQATSRTAPAATATNPGNLPADVIAAAKLAANTPGCKTEIVGSWVWVTTTHEDRSNFEQHGFKFSSNRSTADEIVMYYHNPEQKFKRRTKYTKPMYKVRQRYGTQDAKQLF